MRKTTLIKALALLLSFAMLMTGLPAPSVAESVATATDTVVEQTEDIVIEDEPDTELPVESLPEDETDIPDEPGDDTTEDEMVEEEYIPGFFSAVSPSHFTGEEAVRLGKEVSNLYGYIVQKDGSSSTSITRHWVTVDGTKYTAFCIEASDASTSGRDGGLEPGSDAGLLWILNNVPDSSDEDYAIKQQAVWAYLGQSFSIQNLAAGSRCSMSTDQLRARLTEIVTNAQSASLSGSQELWIAYHLENRSYHQDMAFTVCEQRLFQGGVDFRG